MSNNFCPHLTFRLSFRHDRQNSLSIGDSADGNGEDCHSTVSPHFLPAAKDGGGDGIYEEDNKNKIIKEDDENMLIDDVQEQGSICDMCESRPSPAQWRCLDHRCGLVLCGTSASNHSQYHFEDFPSHMIQENIATKRIWCNECEHEVLAYWENRRPAPAVWSPPDTFDEEPPRGLYNIGNTCFMNAALQCMTAVTQLNSYFMGYCCSLAGRPVGSSYLWFLTEMWADQTQSGAYQKGVMPSRLLHSVRTAHPIFRGFHQHDTQEFLRLFMDTLTEETRVPHFLLEEQQPPELNSDEGSTSSDSETDSFETCDSGNGSEDTGSLQNGDSNCNKNDKLVGLPGGGSSLHAVRDVKVLMKSIVSDIFDGKVESSVQCLSCKQFSRRLEVFQDLSLPIPTRDEMIGLKNAEKYSESEEFLGSNSNNHWIAWMWDWFKSFFVGPTPSLEDCFSAFFSSDELKGKNMYSCEKCKKLRNGVKRCSLHELPEVLCVHLKRFRLFEYGGGIGFSGKVNQYVQFPLDGLDLKRYLHPDCPSKVTTYRLLGVIVHMGSFTGGHYIAYIRRGEQWYVCDDSRVVPVSPETVAESEAYVLFYQKWNDEEDLSKQQVLREWTNKDINAEKEEQFHLLSRKWLTNFCWGEETGPIDNSDVVCPHGYFAPYDTVHMGGTWVPHSVWELLQQRYGGGPDLEYHTECAICTAAWKKHQKQMQKNANNKSTPDSSLSISGNNAAANFLSLGLRNNNY